MVSLLDQYETESQLSNQNEYTDNLNPVNYQSFSNFR